MKKCLIVLYLLLDFFCIEATTNVSLVKPCGLGTPECPYKIGTPGELLYFAEVVNDLLDSIPHNPGACAVLTNDIDLSEVCGPEIGSWTSIGYYNCDYQGTFDGRDHRIENLYLYSTDVIKSDIELGPNVFWGRGFFGIVYDGSIRNLIIGSGYLYTNKGHLGAVAGCSISGTMYNCHNFATVEGDCVYVGGVVGIEGCGGMAENKVEKCSNVGKVTNTSYEKGWGVGGVVGGYGCGVTRNCYNIGTVEGCGRAGGVVGNAPSATIINCYSFGYVKSNGAKYSKVYDCGGIAGYMSDNEDTKTTIADCYCNNPSASVENNKEFFYPKEDFKNGTVFHKLDSLYPGIWTQHIGVDSLPIFIKDNLLEQDEYIHKVKYICKGDSLEYNGKFYKETGIYNGACEDCTELYLKVRELDTTSLMVKIEEGMSYKFGDDLLTESGIYTRLTKNHFGCDSVIILDLQTKPVCKPIFIEIFETICEGDVYDFDGDLYSKKGKYEKKYINSMDCDSFVLLNLDVLPKSVTLIKDTINQGESYSNYNFSVPEQGKAGKYSFKQILLNQSGCDSIVNLELTVLKVKEDNPTTPDIEDNPSVEPETPDVEEPELEIPNIFTPYTEDGINDVFMENYTVFIYDRYGNLVCNSDNGWDGKYKGVLADPGTYVYVLTLKNGEKKKGTIKVLKLK